MVLAVSSPAFQEGGTIPTKYTCQGQDVSPALQWSEPPVVTQSFALIVDDPDAPGGVFTHWVLFNIPSDSRGLPEVVPTQAEPSPPVSTHPLRTGPTRRFKGRCIHEATARRYARTYPRPRSAHWHISALICQVSL